MRAETVTIDMDATVGEAMNLCTSKCIRHLPVLDEEGRLVGLITDRDLRAFISPRIGTISENNADRETLNRHVHVIMIRNLATGSPAMTLAQAARLMLEKRVGCLPIVHDDKRVAGIVTTSDFLKGHRPERKSGLSSCNANVTASSAVVAAGIVGNDPPGGGRSPQVSSPTTGVPHLSARAISDSVP
ncbi:MAG TPA: CBS domain-containing protein [Acidobacteriota bacterium]|nr:CBS domain-containing protein [Acidobacteriota bacterium]